MQLPILLYQFLFSHSSPFRFLASMITTIFEKFNAKSNVIFCLLEYCSFFGLFLLTIAFLFSFTHGNPLRTRDFIAWLGGETIKKYVNLGYESGENRLKLIWAWILNNFYIQSLKHKSKWFIIFRYLFI